MPVSTRSKESNSQMVGSLYCNGAHFNVSQKCYKSVAGILPAVTQYKGRKDKLKCVEIASDITWCVRTPRLISAHVSSPHIQLISYLLSLLLLVNISTSTVFSDQRDTSQIRSSSEKHCLFALSGRYLPPSLYAHYTDFKKQKK